MKTVTPSSLPASEFRHHSDTPRVLIVDDTPANLHVLAEALSDDYELSIATDGARGLELARRREQRPHLILLDVMMPGLSGFEVCRQLKQDRATRDIPVIFVTARGDPEDETLGLSLGAVDYVAKPFHLPIVLARIRNHVNLKIKADLLERHANIDGLTDIPNRRRFDEALAGEWRRAQREDKPLALILLDVDHFKRYNDNYGHGEGDLCLRRIARALCDTLTRPGDLCARYGGEEFAAILPGTDLDGALNIAERLRQNILRLGIPHAGNAPLDIASVSIGCACARPSTGGYPRRLLDLADSMLYEAKAAGRNLVRGQVMTAPGTH